MSVTASVLYDLVECPQRVALDAFGDPPRRDPANAFVKLLWEKGSVFERETIEALDEPFTDLSKLPDPQREQETLAAMQRGDPLIYSGKISHGDLLGIPDILRKEGAGNIPGDIKSGAGEEGGGDDSDGKPKLHYAVQLALYTDILEGLKLSAGRRAFIWDVHGNEVVYDFMAPQGVRKVETLWDEYQAALQEARYILAKKLVPQSAYTSACKLCDWYTYCIASLTASDDLTLIPRLGPKIRDAMQSQVSTIAMLAASDPEAFMDGKKKTIFKGLGPDQLRLFHARAVMLKAAPPKAYLRNPVALPKKSVELFFDIEVDPMRDICYLHGFVERHDENNDTEKFVYFFAEDVTPQEEEKAFRAAYEYMASLPDAAIYYYSKYERTIYRKLQAKYPSVCSEADIEALFEPSRAIDLYGDVVIKATEWPTRDQSIKTIAKYLGFAWRDLHPSGAASIEWFDRWSREKDPAMRQRILDYNEDDCRATRVLLDGIRAL